MVPLVKLNVTFRNTFHKPAGSCQAIQAQYASLRARVNPLHRWPIVADNDERIKPDDNSGNELSVVG